MKQQENNFNYKPLLEIGLWEKTIPDFNIEGLINLIYKLRDTDPGLKISNKGGYHSSNFSHLPQFFPLIKLLNSYFQTHYNRPNVYIRGIWANISTSSNFNIPHHHSPSNNQHDISGILYLKTPKNCGDIHFLPPFNIVPPIIITPKELQLIFFPSTLIHYVEPNLSQEDRISIAFNFE